VKPAQPGQGEFWLTLLDVGQGLSTVIQTQHHTLVYDAGAKFSDSFNAGEAVLVPFLRHQGITQLDKFINSHSDNDHIGGAASLLRTWPPVEILSGMPDTAAERFAGIEGLPDPAQCHHGQGWVWDGVEFEVLYPQPGMSRKGNNASCVLVIRTVDGQAAMLTGDIEGSAEQQLLQQYPGKLPAEVLVAPHHGSKTSSSSGFVSAVLPDRVLFAAGYRNRYGFPKPDVVGRYRRLGSAVHVTGTQGAVSVKFVPGAELEIRTHREEYRRYWHTN
jgi:competence protein ComEC